MGVLAVAHDEARCGRYVMYSKGPSAVLFEDDGRLPSNLLHEIHHHVEHGLHGPHADLAHGDGYDIKFVEKELDTSIDLSVYESPNNDIEASITYYKDKEEFERTHLKIIHPPIYISIIKGKFELQSRD
jgi:hypothetical protein